MELDKFRAMITKEGRSKDDLLQILENCRNSPELANEVRQVLDQRFPTQGRLTRARGSRGSPTEASFMGELRYFNTAKDAYLWLVERIVSVHPEIFTEEIHSDTRFVALGARKMKGEKRRMRNYFARSAEGLFANTPALAENPSYVCRLTNGWYANLNIVNAHKFQILCRLALVSNLTLEKDWHFEILDGTDRLKAAKERARLEAEMLSDT